MKLSGDEFNTADLAQFQVKMHLGFVSALFANALAIYLIIWKSGTMGHYKWFLLNICIMSVLFDVYVSFVLSPYPLLPIWGYCSTGLLKRFGVLWGAIFPMAFLVEGLGLCGLSIFNAAIYRLSAVLNLQRKMTTPIGITAIGLLQIFYNFPSFALAFMVCLDIRDQQPSIIKETLQVQEFILTKIKTYSEVS
ncbi:serpentine type 7TM GPCR chemoreceptor sri domain-containing protein [Ditylenchus destructor]|uniref:Serpentine type 7TM GPCR chemoreceptor sri domain-containing protein n=1 Tax=Ditylenchus destructor TaxID=166010 RepID=A0AAD4R152_9BILA|nr:serpentine type 7TM GPCR chemoreceptor sri domain-containing protein [Ditylenchus destructor]